MRTSARRLSHKSYWAGMSLLLLAGLSGCRHKPAPPPPPAASAPPVTSATVTVITPLPALPPGKAPDVEPAPTPAPPPPPVQQPVHHAKRKSRKTAPPKQDAQVAENEQAPPAATGTPAASSPEQPPATASPAPSIGQLSAGTAISARDRAKMLAEIEAQETRLSKLPTAGNPDAAATQQLIKTFLGKARQAVAQNDLDGAETLNTKARVLLNELQQE